MGERRKGGTTQNVLEAINNLPPAWYKVLPSDQRFVLVMGGGAVLDRETGLVWEQSPSSDKWVWSSASYVCHISTTGGRRGWRLPTLQELQSLLDPNKTDLSLPSGHPFSNVQSANLLVGYYLIDIQPRSFRYQLL